MYYLWEVPSTSYNTIIMKYSVSDEQSMAPTYYLNQLLKLSLWYIFGGNWSKYHGCTSEQINFAFLFFAQTIILFFFVIFLIY